jgi:putative transposase
LNVIDEFTRECLAIEADRSIDADGVVHVLDHLAIQRGGAPAFVRFDNGPEYVAHAVADSCRFTDAESVFIDPGPPWQNAWIESFNSRFRDELLSGRQWDSLLEARVTIEDWRIDHNINRPHTAHGDLTPAEFAAEWRSSRRISRRATPSCSTSRSNHDGRYSPANVDTTVRSVFSSGSSRPSRIPVAETGRGSRRGASRSGPGVVKNQHADV